MNPRMRRHIKFLHSLKPAERRRRQKVGLYRRQKGRCFYCDRLMRLLFGKLPKQPDDLATIEHLDDRFDPARGTHPHGSFRKVLACYGCNQKRSKERQAAHAGARRLTGSLRP